MSTRRELLGQSLREYRKQARMHQWVLAELLEIEQSVLADAEAGRAVEDSVEELLRSYLRTAPRPRKLVALRQDPSTPKATYITPKLLLWASKTGMSTQGMEAVRALRDAYEVAKRDFGLASIPMVQLEVENALTLATRGRYKAMTRPTREMRSHG